MSFETLKGRRPSKERVIKLGSNLVIRAHRTTSSLVLKINSRFRFYGSSLMSSHSACLSFTFASSTILI